MAVFRRTRGFRETHDAAVRLGAGETAAVVHPLGLRVAAIVRRGHVGDDDRIRVVVNFR